MRGNRRRDEMKTGELPEMNLEEIAVSTVKGVGKQSAENLAQLHIFSVLDLLEYFPSRYEDQNARAFEELRDQEMATIVGEVISPPITSFYGRKKSRCTFQIKMDLCVVKVILFNQTYVKKSVELGDFVRIHGKWESNRLTITGKFLGKETENSEDSFHPIYPLKSIVTQTNMRKWVINALTQYGHYVCDWMPDGVRSAYKLPSKLETYYALHLPKEAIQLRHGRRRMVYEELFFFQMKMQLLRKRIRENSEGRQIQVNQDKLETFIHSYIPFSLTEAQQRVLNEIIGDLSSPYLLYRLLQGDVGSGKTVVAMIACYITAIDGYQSALMVPTEILARQHFESFRDLLAPLGIQVACLTSSTKTKERREILADIKIEKIQVLIGTHALLQERVQFHKLGFIVMDEQHRFGVEQRKTLREKGNGHMPNVLHMTATPIPRTLAITAFGEMDVSVIDQMPAGRKPIRTKWVKEDVEQAVWDFLVKEVSEGRQAYIICPLIEESENLDLQNAYELFERLKFYVNERFLIGLLHGRMRPQEKDEMMEQFKEGQMRVLVSTTVIEVGINVPNASVMVIYDAERFGLAQLHQLRGRVGRGAKQSYCILIGDPKTDIGKERLKIMTETNDGFEIAGKDLELRGPGDFFGAKQSGIPDFKVANIVHDYRALEVARRDAVRLVEGNQLWKDPDYTLLREFLEQKGYFETHIFD